MITSGSIAWKMFSLCVLYAWLHDMYTDTEFMASVRRAQASFLELVVSTHLPVFSRDLIYFIRLT